MRHLMIWHATDREFPSPSRPAESQASGKHALPCQCMTAAAALIGLSSWVLLPAPGVRSRHPALCMNVPRHTGNTVQTADRRMHTSAPKQHCRSTWRGSAVTAAVHATHIAAAAQGSASATHALDNSAPMRRSHKSHHVTGTPALHSFRGLQATEGAGGLPPQAELLHSVMVFNTHTNGRPATMFVTPE